MYYVYMLFVGNKRRLAVSHQLQSLAVYIAIRIRPIHKIYYRRQEYALC